MLLPWGWIVPVLGGKAGLRAIVRRGLPHVPGDSSKTGGGEKVPDRLAERRGFRGAGEAGRSLDIGFLARVP